MSRKIRILSVIAVHVVLLCLCACENVSDVECRQIDSLNILAYQTKYKSLDEAEGYVNEVLTRYAGTTYRDGLHEAMLGKGDVLGMRMEYDSAQVCYKEVLDATNNDLIGCMADVNMMSVCLMTAMNKEFYDYRSDALERMANVEEESSDMTEHQQMLWKAVQTDYHFVSANYFIKMRQDNGVSEEFDWLEEHQDLFAADTARLSAYLFLKSLYTVKDGSTSDTMDEMQRNLIRLLSLSKQSGYIYFEVSALNALAKSIMRGGEMKPSRWVFIGELLGDLGFFPLEYKLANRALKLSRQYGNDFVQTTALVTLSDFYLKEGKDSLALVQMEDALGLINENHQKMCRHKHETETHEVLYAYSAVEDTLSTEMKWIADPDVIAVPEWMAMVREQLSVVYGAMGMKAASDYNHNIYFDILDVTRQDLRVQQEEENLMQEEQMLNLLLWFFAVAIVVLLWLLYVYSKRSRQEYHKKVNVLSQVIDICKRLSSALSEAVEDEDDLDKALHGIADADVERLFPQVKGHDWTQVEPAQMKGLDKELFHVLLLFYNWMRQKGLLFIQFTQQQQQLEGETYVFEKRLEENKRQYIEKLTSMSIVNGITPFLDRALHEVNKLKTDKDASPSMVRERFHYLSELIDKINDYNDVLGHWVKIRQGMVTLNIENFALQPLFETMKRGTRTFDSKGVSLSVDDTPSVVKADKSLTLFMMNTLLDNARKYTPEGGLVKLSATETDAYVEVSVSDTGHGMSAEDVDTLNNAKVYDSSKIGAEGEHASAIKQNKGFGFGLMNCKGIIGKYKKTNAVFNVCEFGVESEIGQGSRFFFRLPKGVMKAMMCVAMLLMGGTMNAESQQEHAAAYIGRLYSANVSGNYEQAILYADSAIQCLNQYYEEMVSKGTHLMSLEGGEMAELEWWKSGMDADYELIIGLRNEVAIAALALNRNSLYHYNSEVFTRLYKLISTDPTLEEYCNNIKMANRNKKTTAILLGMLIFLVIAAYFFLYYRNNQLFVFNLRQFIQLNNKVFTSTEDTLPEVLHQSLSDIKTADTVGMMLPSEDHDQPFLFTFTGNAEEQSVYESMMQSAYHQKKEMTSSNGHFHAYPLFVPGTEDESLVGVLGVRFYDGKLTDEERLIMNLVVQFMSIHTYFSYHKVGEMNELLELKQDERMRIDNEQQKVYVRNQIMDNSLSTLKHETMYYPNRIKQLVDATLETPDASISQTTIHDIDELLTYYKEMFTILSTCAGKQVEMVLFKRTILTAQAIGEMATRSFRKQGKKGQGRTAIQVTPGKGLSVQGDKIFLQTLIDNIISLYFEHQSGGDLLLDFDVSDGFAKFAFTDTAYRYDDQTIPLLFYVDNVRYDAKTDTLSGAQYMICRQVIREHDAHSSRRGCRIYVENSETGKGSRFIFTLPLS
ncbi:MAG: DUF5113 domain-containing protein [Bacteroidaceae bacterium]|nr:DUF5113 domain-containing protein [Bacteroidaceae bacterium]